MDISVLISSAGCMGRVSPTIADPLGRKPMDCILLTGYIRCLKLGLVDVRGPQIFVTVERVKVHFRFTLPT